MPLSIIIPCYNVAPYLAQCLDSVFINNAFKGEVICVNDGSTDHTLAILQQYADRYPNLRLVNQPNAGLSAARNTGLQHASGDYIYFLDSDDYLYPDVLNRMLQIAQPENLEMLAMSVLKDGSEPYFTHHLHIEGIVTGKQYIKRFYDACGFAYQAPVWMYLYKREFLLQHHLIFKEGFLHEDEDFTPRALVLCDRMMLWNEAVQYHRVKRDGAITSVVTDKHLKDIVNILAGLVEEILPTILDEECGRIVRNNFGQLYLTAMLEAQKNHIRLNHCFSNSDFVSWNSCVSSEFERRVVRLAKYSPAIAVAYYRNEMPIWLRKVINRAM